MHADSHPRRCVYRWQVIEVDREFQTWRRPRKYLTHSSNRAKHPHSRASAASQLQGPNKPGDCIMPHRGSQSSDISRQITQFGNGLSSFTRRVDDDIAELKRAVSANPHTGRALLDGQALTQHCTHMLTANSRHLSFVVRNADAQMQHCLHDMLHRVTASGQDISALECMTIDAISLEVCCLTAPLLSRLPILTHQSRHCLFSPGNMWALPSALPRKSSTNQPSGKLPAAVWLPTSSSF